MDRWRSCQQARSPQGDPREASAWASHSWDGEDPVLCLINADTGESRSTVVTDVSGKTLRKHIAQNVHMDSSHLMTDEALAYKSFSHEWASHKRVTHRKGEYVRGTVSSNQAENFFTQLKRSLDGTHHSVSKEHLNR